MAAQKITNSRLETSPVASYVSIETADGNTYQTGAIPFPLFAAIAAIVQGPNPGYDPGNFTFISISGPTHHLTDPLIAEKIEGVAKRKFAFNIQAL